MLVVSILIPAGAVILRLLTGVLLPIRALMATTPLPEVVMMKLRLMFTLPVNVMLPAKLPAPMVVASTRDGREFGTR